MKLFNFKRTQHGNDTTVPLLVGSLNGEESDYAPVSFDDRTELYIPPVETFIANVPEMTPAQLARYRLVSGVEIELSRTQGGMIDGERWNHIIVATHPEYFPYGLLSLAVNPKPTPPPVEVVVTDEPAIVLPPPVAVASDEGSIPIATTPTAPVVVEEAVVNHVSRRSRARGYWQRFKTWKASRPSVPYRPTNPMRKVNRPWYGALVRWFASSRPEDFQVRDNPPVEEELELYAQKLSHLMECGVEFPTTAPRKMEPGNVMHVVAPDPAHRDFSLHAAANLALELKGKFTFVPIMDNATRLKMHEEAERLLMVKASECKTLRNIDKYAIVNDAVFGYFLPLASEVRARQMLQSATNRAAQQAMFGANSAIVVDGFWSRFLRACGAPRTVRVGRPLLA